MKDKPIKTDSAENLQRVVPVVLAANDRYAPYAGVAIASLIAHADPRYTYRVFVLHTSISSEHIEKLEMLSTDNVTVRCLNVERAMSAVHAPLPVMFYFSEEAYYRILIPKLDELNIYPYVIYLDCDVVLNSDIAGIIPNNMGDNLIAAVRDLPQQQPGWRDRLERDYHLIPEQYINSGVLVFNIRQWMEERTADRCFDYLGNPTGKFLGMDQDVINIICEKRIYYLDIPWNYQWYLLYGEEAFVEKCRPITERIGDSFHILHYTSHIKPWNTPERPLSHYFWSYARYSPFFDEILTANLRNRAELEKTNDELEKTNDELEKTKEELRSVYRSVSFRVGRAITWLPRKIRGGVRCYREHGVRYTVRRFFEHVTGKAQRL